MNATTGAPARVTCRLEIPAVCPTSVPSQTRACPRFPPRNLNGKEGVDGSSPSEGSAKAQQIGDLSLGLTCTSSRMRRYGADYGAFR